MEKRTMTCPKCGGAMNHHADKVIYANEPSDASPAHEVFGGVVEETHACPACGAVETRCAE
jgi:ribosomal protein S27AE